MLTPNMGYQRIQKIDHFQDWSFNQMVGLEASESESTNTFLSYTLRYPDNPRFFHGFLAIGHSDPDDWYYSLLYSHPYHMIPIQTILGQGQSRPPKVTKKSRWNTRNEWAFTACSKLVGSASTSQSSAHTRASPRRNLGSGGNHQKDPKGRTFEPPKIWHPWYPMWPGFKPNSSSVLYLGWCWVIYVEVAANSR